MAWEFLLGEKMREKNEYDIQELARPDAPSQGSFDIHLKAVTEHELRIDYWTGAFLAAALIYQIISGMLLAYYYQPGEPYTSTLSLMETVPFGRLLLTSHLYMAYAMVGLVYFHMFRQYFTGAYRGRWRWLQWIIGVFIFAFVNAIAVIGYLLSQTYIGIAALHVSELLIERSIVGRLFPGLANFVVAILIGNGTTLETWEHLLILHAAILSVIVLVLVGIHFFLYEKSGPYEMYPERHSDNERKIPWFPVNILYTALIAFFFIGIVLIFAALFPQVLQPPYGGLEYGTTPFPDWYVMPVYKLMDVAGFGLTTGGVPLLIAFFLYLFILPFIDRYSGNEPLNRPMITFMGVFVIISFTVIAIWGYAQPGLSQTRPLTLALWFGITFASIVPVYAMKHAKKDSEKQ